MNFYFLSRPASSLQAARGPRPSLRPHVHIFISRLLRKPEMLKKGYVPMPHLRVETHNLGRALRFGFLATDLLQGAKHCLRFRQERWELNVQPVATNDRRYLRGNSERERRQASDCAILLPSLASRGTRESMQACRVHRFVIFAKEAHWLPLTHRPSPFLPGLQGGPRGGLRAVPRGPAGAPQGPAPSAHPRAPHPAKLQRGRRLRPGRPQPQGWVVVELLPSPPPV